MALATRKSSVSPKKRNPSASPAATKKKSPTLKSATPKKAAASRSASKKPAAAKKITKKVTAVASKKAVPASPSPSRISRRVASKSPLPVKKVAENKKSAAKSSSKASRSQSRSTKSTLVAAAPAASTSSAAPASASSSSSKRMSSRKSISSGSSGSSSSLSEKVNRFYLINYNLCSLVLWLKFAHSLVMASIKTGASPRSIFDATALSLAQTQSVAVLEVLNSLFGVVKSAPLTNAIQVGSRLLVAWWAAYRMNGGSSSPRGYLLLAGAWTVCEVFRYSFYLNDLICRSSKKNKACLILSKTLLWARYSLFYILYPMGTIGEMSLLWNASKDVTEPLQKYAIFALLVLYPFGFLKMYSHMMKLRGKAL